MEDTASRNKKEERVVAGARGMQWTFYLQRVNRFVEWLHVQAVNEWLQWTAMCKGQGYVERSYRLP